ncbi:regulator of microtubule dynamics protein 2-like [Sinocyclocheilus anshuiensis]|uniref:regulator of microtubule dynamics protein 2-like n=1 Tax=Sinocyclocheilus anshuiensis TaxID=1608454 RepID=UPI0007B86CEE|nr:PREDICTED: regulator of microtubule dynamics protein 2-like [Sinocyclocheilus anshuiensis]
MPVVGFSVFVRVQEKYLRYLSCRDQQKRQVVPHRKKPLSLFLSLALCLKDHLDKAIELKPEDPLSYYLLGRWCYAVSQCTWIERKIAATLFGEPPSATVQDALQNFLKVEEISPKYSKFNYVFLAKCYKDLGQRSQAQQMCDAASAMNIQTKEDEEAQKELDSFVASL